MPVVDTEIAARGLWVVISLVFASGLGLPVPSAPVLLGAGVLAGSGRFSLAGVIAGAFLAHLATDFIWYGLGRWRGQRILALLCRISLDPDTCVQRTGDLFARRQSTALVISKFVPGLRIVAAPLAGMLRVPVAGFATWDGLGTLLWVGTLAVVGYLFSGPVARAAAPAAILGPWLVLAVLRAFATSSSTATAPTRRARRAWRCGCGSEESCGCDPCWEDSRPGRNAAIRSSPSRRAWGPRWPPVPARPCTETMAGSN